MLNRLRVEAVAGQTRDGSCKKFHKNLSPL
jgi:hypothetical protein